VGLPGACPGQRQLQFGVPDKFGALIGAGLQGEAGILIVFVRGHWGVFLWLIFFGVFCGGFLYRMFYLIRFEYK
jgi:hypothetical protein